MPNGTLPTTEQQTTQWSVEFISKGKNPRCSATTIVMTISSRIALNLKQVKIHQIHPVHYKTPAYKQLSAQNPTHHYICG